MSDDEFSSFITEYDSSRWPIAFPPTIILPKVPEQELKLYFKLKCNDCQSTNVASTFSFLTEEETKQVIEENKK